MHIYKIFSQVVAPAMYVRLVTAKVSHIETILKLIGTPEPMLVERFRYVRTFDSKSLDQYPFAFPFSNDSNSNSGSNSNSNDNDSGDNDNNS